VARVRVVRRNHGATGLTKSGGGGGGGGLKVVFLWVGGGVGGGHKVASKDIATIFSVLCQKKNRYAY